MAADKSKLSQVTRWLLAALFLVTGALKARDPAGTALGLGHYQLLPSALVVPAAYYGPWLEFFAGCALLSRRLRAGGWLLSALLGAVFLVFTGSALARGLDISCGCFGTGNRGSLPAMAALDVVIVILSLRGLAGCVRARRDTTAPRAPRTG
ncbi:MAG: hypothetical protein RIS54_168 [Verrucomicrobiota bacterium]|jgi:hypothetical protein